MNTVTTVAPSSSDALLRFAMRLDATLTGAAGLGIAAFAYPLATLTGLTSTQLFVAGAAFVLYGVVVYRLAGLSTVRRAGGWVIGANIACTVAAAIVVIDSLAPLTAAGVALTLAAGAYTAAFAVLQYLGVRRLA